MFRLSSKEKKNYREQKGSKKIEAQQFSQQNGGTDEEGRETNLEEKALGGEVPTFKR